MSLLRLGARGRIDRGVETDQTIDALLAADAPVAIGVSGGKDSVAAALATIAHLDAIKHSGPRILIHADLGDEDPSLSVEWTDSLPTCERLAAHLGIELLIARRKAGGMMKRWQKRWSNNVARFINLECVKIILPWSTPAMRFCTSELKSAPMASALVRRFPGQTIVSACGVRRQESKERAKATTSKLNKRLTSKAHKTSGVDWNPIAAWSDLDVFAFAAAKGFAMHEGYSRYSMSRISCRYCIMAKRSDLVASSTCADNAPVFRTMVKLEIDSTFGFQGSSWLADVAPHLLDAETLAAVADSKARGLRRAALESQIPKHLLYTKGWPHQMPTAEEAVLLCSLRQGVAAELGLRLNHTTPEALLARYAELMAENAKRNTRKGSRS